MLEGAVMEYAKWFIGLVSIMFVAVASMYMFKMNEVNGFQQQVNYQIERHGGLTEEAMVVLNEYSKQNYGGCIVESNADFAPCLFPEDRENEVKSSGFFVSEFRELEPSNVVVGESGERYTHEYFVRGNNERARYGTNISYIISRQIGSVGEHSFLKPAVIGESASRVRGN